MASLARPTSIARSSCSSRSVRSLQIRPLSTSQPRNAAPTNSISLRGLPKQQSMATRMKKLRISEIPTDMGLLPMTYVRPCGKMPSFFSQPRTRLQLEWFYFKQSWLDLAQSCYANRWSGDKDPVTGKRKKVPMGLRERYTVTRDLHTQLYSAIAQGDRATLKKIACSGLENQQTKRIDTRRMDRAPEEAWSVKYRGLVLPERLYWTIQSLVPSWFKSIHVIADRQATLPVGPGVVLRQLFVRVDSKQTLSRNDGSGPVSKDLREYIVLQRAVVEGEPQEWRVWGTMSPTDTETALQLIKDTKQQSGGQGLVDRVRAMMNMA